MTTIKAGTYYVSTGTYDVTLADGAEARLNVSGGSEESVCSLEFTTVEGGNKVDVFLLDNGCDGVDLIKKRPHGEKNYGGGEVGGREENLLMTQAITMVRIASDPVDGNPSKAEIYFETGMSNLSETATKVLDSFVQTYKGGPVIVEGHCDPRGTPKFNHRLGAARATTAADYLRKAFQSAGKDVPKFFTVSFGESRATGDAMEKDRRAFIISDETVMKRALDSIKNPAPDIYLIDSSGSMWEGWKVVREYIFPKKSKIRNFNSCRGITAGVGHPDCNTPLWDSAYTAVDKMKKGGILAVISDGMDTSSTKADPKKLIALARKKRIKISVVYVGEQNAEIEKQLVDIATKTGGAFYIRTK